MNKSEIKTVVFLSNYFNHHQKPFSDAMFERLGVGYTFIETAQMSEERRKLGYGNDVKPSYVKFYDGCTCQSLLNDADVVIMGSAPYNLIEHRLKHGKLTFTYSERLYKNKCEIYKLPIRFLRHQKRFGQYRNLYLLCASAYTSADYAKTFTFINKAYKWGYFPETKKYDDIDSLIASKDSKKILWCGRFLNLKHPEDAIQVAKRLRDEGYDFQMDIIGMGNMEGELCRLNAENGLIDRVHLLGSMSPEEVRTHMEQASIYLFTSDRHEGWGAVLNESMNSACAVVASHAIGSVPFLIEHEKNGLIYRDGDVDDLYQKVKFLLDNPKERVKIAQNAYETIVNEWNAENAADCFLILAEQLIDSKKKAFPFDCGVCSKARILKDNWFVKQNNI